MAKEKKIRHQKASLLETILNNSSDAIILLNSKGVISNINNIAAKLFGYSRGELLKKNIKVLFPELSTSTFKKQSDKNTKTTTKAKSKAGKSIKYKILIAKSTLNGRIIYAIILKNKKTKKKKLKKLLKEISILEQKISILTKKNEELSKNQFSPENAKVLRELKSRFVSMASHEFRTPLALIKSSASIISHYKTTELNDRREKHITRIKNAVNNLTGILNDFTSLGRLEEGEIDNQPISFDIRTLMEDVVEEMKSLLKPNQKIITECPVNNTTIFLDNRWLKNIFINLISNAIKFSEEGKSIYCTILIKNKKLHIIVRDEGCGIPESAKQHIFTRFFRAKNVANIQGTGLGLNIIKSYLKLFDGKIWFESELGEGSTFFIEIPLKEQKEFSDI